MRSLFSIFSILVALAFSAAGWCQSTLDDARVKKDLSDLRMERAGIVRELERLKKIE